MRGITFDWFVGVLPSICTSSTSLDSAGWVPSNPLWGHCAVVSVLAQNLFGGELLRASLEGTAFAAMRSHYWNRIADGREIDFTEAQFCGRRPSLIGEPRDRAYVLSSVQTRQRYELLVWRLAKAACDGSPLFEDEIYRQCFFAALNSPCQKLGFGCVITRDGEVVHAGCNQTIPQLRSLCEPICIRLGIQSRTESMIGACAHAEEGMWEVIHRGIPIGECELYVAGLDARRLPLIRDIPEHSCLRCAVQMHHARLRRVYVPLITGWAGISTDYALETALAYATGRKKA